MRTMIKDQRYIAAIFLTILITFCGQHLAYGNEAPNFTDGDSTTRSIAENIAADTNIGTAVAATDADNDTLTYSLGGTNASAFSINSTTGQLQTNAALDYETKSSYSVTVSASDGNGGRDSISVSITVTDVSEKPVFAPGGVTLTIAENTASGTNIGTPITATDPDSGDTLTYSLRRGDKDAFSIDPNTGQVRTKAALNYERKNAYTDLAVRATDSTGLTGATRLTINVTDVHENRAPRFADGLNTTRTVAENTARGQNIGSAIAATDADNDTLTYHLRGKYAPAFSIVSTSGQLQTKAPLDYETQSSYAVTVFVSDGNNGSDTILVTINVTDVAENRAPVFTDGSRTTRAVAENTASGQSIGTAVAATDADNDTLTYSLRGTDASSFSIVSTSGQLQTRAALDYETKASYSVTVSVSDRNGGRDSITVTITVTDVNENSAPVFTDGSSATRAIAENTASGQSIGTAVAATDADNDTLTYSLGGTDASSFSIISTSGQLQTRAALDYEIKTSYSVTVSVSDGNGGSDSIPVTITVTDVNENRAPVFRNPYRGGRTSRSVAENTAPGKNIGEPFTATDPDNDTLTYTLAGPDASSFSIVSRSGQLKTKVALDYETKSAYIVVIIVSDGNGGRNGVSVTINVTDVNENRAPVLADGDSTTRSVAENTASGQNIGSAVAATDADNDGLIYTLSGTDAAAFSIVRTSGQLQTNAALDYETQSSYSVTVAVSDRNGGSDSIIVTINITDIDENTIDPPLSERTQQVRDAIVATARVNSIDNVTAAHLAAITTLDIRQKSITSLKAGDFNGLTSLTALYLDFNSISDISALDDLTSLTTLSLQNNSISDISALDDLTSLTTLSLQNNSISDISTLDDLTSLTDLYLSSNSINDISALDDLTSLTTLSLDSTSISDISALDDLTSLTVLYLSFNSISDISALDDLTELRELALSFNSISDVSALEDLTSLTDLYLRDNPILDYGPLHRLKTANPDVTIDIDLNNNLPVFSDGDSATRSIAENTAAGTNIGTAVAATDADNHTLTYSLSGTDAASFSINSTNGQLRTSAALDYETKSSYTVTVTAYDGNSGADRITVTINVTDVNEGANNAPVFTDGTSTTRTVAENTASGTNIGTAVAATDADNDTLTYSLGGTDAAAFRINGTTGQLQTGAALDHETKSSYAVSVSVSDGNDGSDSITVTITVTDVNEKPVFAPGGVTFTVVENTASGTNIGDPITATDPDSGDTLTYSLQRGDADSFSIDPSTGQVRTKAALDYETKDAYTDLAVRATDSTGLVSATRVTINVTDVHENSAPVFTDGASTTRAIAEETASGVDIGSAISATDADNDTLTYTLGGTDAASFSIVSTSGQLQTSAALHYETKLSYTVTVTVSDGNNGEASITVTINVTNVTIEPPLSGRTQQVQDAIVAAVNGVNNADDVTEAHLAAINLLDLRDKGITSLKTRDFHGLTGMTMLRLSDNDLTTLPSDIFDGLTRLEWLGLYDNALTALPSGVFDGLTRLFYLYMDDNDLTTLPSDIFDGLTTLVTISLEGNALTTLPSDIFHGRTRLIYLHLRHNALTTLPSGVFDGLTALSQLDLASNALTTLPSGIFDKLLKDGETQLRWIGLDYNVLTSLPSGIFDRLTSLDTLFLDDNNITDVSAVEDVTTLEYLFLLGNPISDYEPLRKLKAAVEAANLSIDIEIDFDNTPPVFSDGDSTTRSVAENTDAGTNIGAAVAATDTDTSDTLSYSLGGTDADSFDIVSTSGQLQTKAALDYETQTSYTVTVTAYDGNSGGDRITVTIDVTDVVENVQAAPSVETSPVIPVNTALLTNFPNPFNPETWIPYQLAKPAEVTLTIYDIRGIVVRELKLGHQPAGMYQSRSRAIHWDGRNNIGEKVASGVYFYTLTAGEFTATRKLLIRK